MKYCLATLSSPKLGPDLISVSTALSCLGRKCPTFIWKLPKSHKR